MKSEYETYLALRFLRRDYQANNIDREEYTYRVQGLAVEAYPLNNEFLRDLLPSGSVSLKVERTKEYPEGWGDPEVAFLEFQDLVEAAEDSLPHRP